MFLFLLLGVATVVGVVGYGWSLYRSLDELGSAAPAAPARAPSAGKGRAGLGGPERARAAHADALGGRR
jgi:hypothetical protein